MLQFLPNFSHMKLSCICVVLLALVSNLRADVTVHPLFSDHAVLQKSNKVPIWGWADPEETVKVTIDGTTAATKTASDGKWRLDLNLEDKAPGPFELIVEGKNKLTIRDVVIGEVWVCSGQSNMELVLAHTKGAKEEIATSTNPMLRHFAVKKATSMTPLEKLSGRWVVAGPSTSGEFTAVGYWFGKALNKAMNVPVGLIHASWGGTPSEGWTSAEAIDTDPHLKARRQELFEILQSAPELKASYPGRINRWVEANHRQDTPSDDVASFVAGSTEDWTRVNLPGKVAGPGLPTTGAVWVRREVEVPPTAIGKDAKFEFELPNAFDAVYWNGNRISQPSPGIPPGAGRTVIIPGAQIKAGKATLAIRVYAPSVLPEFTGNPDRIRLFGTKINGTWFAKSEREFPALSEEALAAAPKMPRDPAAQGVASCLFNGMIAPIIPYAIRGTIWYQGENNVSRASSYRTAFLMLITDWRTKWNRGNFPFYFCQLANYDGKWKQPGDNPWAELREAQSLARKLPNTGMAVLIDIGETKDIHPRNKKDVGERLAAIALARDYGKKTQFAGPAFDSMKIDKGRAVVQFKNAEDGLVARPLPKEELYRSSPHETGPLFIPRPNSELQGFAVCGEDRKWKWADAKIQGNTVVVSSDEVSNPVAVRYAWANNPTCNLYNQAGFPAEPFRTDSFPATTLGKQY
jgi:sialate O-acetylesterase